MSTGFPNLYLAGRAFRKGARPPGQGMAMLVLLGASSLTAMSGTAITPAIPGIAVEFAGTPNAELLAKLTLTLPALFIALAASPLGALVDRVGARPVLLWSSLLFAIAGGSGLLAPDLMSLLAGRAFLGISIAGLSTATLALIGSTFDEEGRRVIVGYQGAAMSFGGMMFLVLGGAIATWGWRWSFVTYLSSFVLVPLILFGLRDAPAMRPNKTNDNHHQRPVRWLNLLAIYLVAMLGMMIFYVIPVQLPFHLAAHGTLDPALAGYALATCTLISALTSFSYHHVRRIISAAGAITLTFLFIGAGLALSVSGNYREVVIGMAVAGLGTGLLLPTVNSLILSAAPIHLLGRASGGLAACLFLGQFLAPFAIFFVAGPSPDAAFERAAVASASAAMVVGLFWCVQVTQFHFSRSREGKTTK